MTQIDISDEEVRRYTAKLRDEESLWACFFTIFFSTTFVFGSFFIEATLGIIEPPHWMETVVPRWLFFTLLAVILAAWHYPMSEEKIIVAARKNLERERLQQRSYSSVGSLKIAILRIFPQLAFLYKLLRVRKKEVERITRFQQRLELPT